MVNKHLENMNSFDTASPEYWMLEAFKSLEKNENDTARLFAEKAVKIDNHNLDAQFLFLTTLIKKIDDPSIHKLETNRDKSRNVMNILREKRKEGKLSEKQETKFKEMSKLQFEFVEYVEREVWRIKLSFD